MALSQTRAHSEIDWRSFVDVLPAGLDLVSPASVMRQAFELVSNAASTHRYIAVIRQTQAVLLEAQIPIRIEDRRSAGSLLARNELTEAQRRSLGQRALELYFAQLLQNDSALLDLWPSRLSVDTAGETVWTPRPIYVVWDLSFVSAVRDVYLGFFVGDEARFRGGLDGLGLGAAGMALLRHLGEGNQGAVRFGVESVQSTLREIVALRTVNDRGLHRNFVAFGLYLASLHELLGSLDLAFDVRSAFMRVGACEG